MTDFSADWSSMARIAGRVETHEQINRVAQRRCDVTKGCLIGHRSSARDAIPRLGDDDSWRGPGVHARVRTSSS